MKNDIIFNEICNLCNCIVSIEDGEIERADTGIPEYYTDCEHSKNGYCGVFRAQAKLDEITFNMHHRNV